MNPAVVRLFRFATLTSLALPAGIFAQGRFDNTAIPLQFLETSPWTVTAGLRFSPDGASVNFGQLGNVSASISAPPLTDGAVQRLYHDGAVGVDGARNNEKDAAGNVFSTPGGRYQGRVVDSTGNETYTGDYLAYTQDRTRVWGFQDASQVGSDGRLALSQFSAESSGATAVADSGASGGFEISVNRRLRRFGKRAEFGVSAMFGMNDIDADTKGSVQANLLTLTDYYRLYGTAPEAPYSGPSFTDLKNDAGETILVNGLETTVPIDQVPVDRQLFNAANGATILGSWKINGAYYVVRIGPLVRVFITDRLAFTVEAGLAGAFVGSSFEVEETIDLPELAAPITSRETDEKTDFLAGFYGSGTVEYWMTDRTNAYAGAAYESLDEYQQSVNGRTAEIDIGSTVTVRFGLTTRF